MLKPSEREKLQDCLMLVESARDILSALPPGLDRDLTHVQDCFRTAGQTLATLLRG